MRFLLPLIISFLIMTEIKAETPGGLPVSVGPSVKLPSGLYYSILGSTGAENPEKILDCYLVLNGLVGYTNAQSQASCFEAQTACIRLGLIQQFMDVHKNMVLQQRFPGTPFDRVQLQSQFKAAYADTKLKLVGCALAAAAGLITDSLIEQAGFLPPNNPHATQPHIGIYDTTP